MQVVQSELIRSSNVVSNPMANMRDQIHTACPSTFNHMRTVRAHDGVRMAAWLAGANDRIHPSVENRFGARQTEESVGGGYKQKP
jgi:hypothetical protein